MNGSSFLLLQTNAQHPIVGISSSVSETELVITIQGTGVQLYEVFDQKCLFSWSQKERRRWTVPAIEVPRFGDLPSLFFGVLDDRLLCSWSRTDSVVDQHTKMLEEPVAQVFGDLLLVNKLLLVMRNASLRIASLDLNTVSAALAPPDASDASYVEWTHMITSPATGVVFFLVLHSNTETSSADSSTSVTYHLNVYSVSPYHDHPAEKKKRKREEANRGAANVTVIKETPKEQEVLWRASHKIAFAQPIEDLVSCTFDNSSLSLAILSSESVLQILQFPSIESLIGESNSSYRIQYSAKLAVYRPMHPQRFRERRQTQRQPNAVQNQDFANVSAATLNSFLVLAGKRKSARKDVPHVVLTLWDMAFGTLQGKFGIGFDEEEGKQITQISAEEPIISTSVGKAGWLAIATKEHVAIATVDVGAPGLASCLNRLSTTAGVLVNDPARPPLSVTPSLLACLGPKVKKAKTEIAQAGQPDAAWEKELKELNAEEEKVIALLLDTQQTRNLEEFMRHFNGWLNRKKRELKRAEKETDKGKAAAVGLKKPQELSQNFVCRVAGRCLDSHYWEPLLYLVRSGLLVTNGYPQYASVLVERKQLEIIRQSLLNCDDLSEKALAQFLKFFLKERNSAFILDYVNKYDTGASANAKKYRDADERKAEKKAKAKAKAKAKKAKFAKAESKEPEKAKEEKKDPMVTPEDQFLEQLGKLTDPSAAAFKFINMILSKPINDTFMEVYMKDIPFADILVFLQHLQFWLSYHCREETHLKAKVERVYHWNVPSLKKVVLWLDMTLDSHVTEFVMVEEGHATVEAIRAMVKEQVTLYEGLDNFMGYVTHFLAYLKKKQKKMKKEGRTQQKQQLGGKAKKFKKQGELPDYSIEVLML